MPMTFWDGVTLGAIAGLVIALEIVSLIVRLRR